MVEVNWRVYRFSRAIHSKMIAMWTAELTNDPSQDYRLYVELLEDDQYRGRIEMDRDGRIVLVLYECAQPLHIPGEWLLEMLSKAKAELKES